MKTVQRIVPVIFLITVLFACKKSKDTNTSTDIIGSWELAETSAAMIPVITYPTGNGDFLVITDSTYAYYGARNLVKSGTYTIIDDATVEQNVCLVIPDDQFTRRIVFDNNYSTPKVFVDIRDGKLSFISDCYALDAGHKSVYRHIDHIDGIGN
jgi:hypothetical protein